MDERCERTVHSLRRRHIRGVFVENSNEARLKILDLIPRDAVVGMGDSTALRQLGIPGLLQERGTRLLNAFEPSHSTGDPPDTEERRRRILGDAASCDVFLTGTNAVTEDGRLVNVDAMGNRVAGMFWGHRISVIAIGKNKIVRDLEEAFDRIRNVIAPNHIHIRTAQLGGVELKTPCAATGKCSDCRTPDRACNVLTIIEGRPWWTDLNVVLVNEDLGLGWDPSWSQERITHIIENYRKFVWVDRMSRRPSVPSPREP
jgi:hypothetical protein